MASLTGCALYGAEDTGSDYPPPNSTWVLTEITASDTRLVPDADQLGGKAPDIRFGSTDPSGTRYTVTGYLGCNAFSGLLRFTGINVVVEELYHTEIACQPYPAGIEGAYLEGLHNVDRYSLSEDILTFHHAGGSLLFQQAP